MPQDLATHFSGRKINMQPFMDMNLSVRHHIIVWIPREDKLDLLNLLNDCIWCIIKQYYILDTVEEDKGIVM
jgi:hypothetical protein